MLELKGNLPNIIMIYLFLLFSIYIKIIDIIYQLIIDVEIIK